VKHYTKNIGTIVSIPCGQLAMIEGYYACSGEYSVYFFVKSDGKRRGVYKPEELKFLNGK